MGAKALVSPLSEMQLSDTAGLSTPEMHQMLSHITDTTTPGVDHIGEEDIALGNELHRPNLMQIADERSSQAHRDSTRSANVMHGIMDQGIWFIIL